MDASSFRTDADQLQNTATKPKILVVATSLAAGFLVTGTGLAGMVDIADMNTCQSKADGVRMRFLVELMEKKNSSKREKLKREADAAYEEAIKECNDFVHLHEKWKLIVVKKLCA